MASREKQLKNISKYGNFVGLDGKIFQDSAGKSQENGQSKNEKTSFVNQPKAKSQSTQN